MLFRSLRHIPGFPLEHDDDARRIDDPDHAGCFVLEGHDKDVHTLAWAPWDPAQTGPRLLASCVVSLFGGLGVGC